MPELPEVETVRKGLEPALAGARLAQVNITRPDLRYAFPRNFVARLTGARILCLRRRGKFILAPLDSEETLIVHLGMTGRFVVGGGLDPAEGEASGVGEVARHAHVFFRTDGGACVAFIDARRFGFMDIAKAGELWTHPSLAGLGPEPFDATFCRSYLSKALANCRRGVKSLLMDQSMVAGLGNIYASEALHRARIAPDRPGGDVGKAALGRIVPAVRAVLGEAIASGGSTLRDFASVGGSPGYFQHRFRVYGREGEPCLTPACPGRIRRTLQAGRATFHCPACQG
jgi:formamidopyrimidine-DNA glycosylase